MAPSPDLFVVCKNCQAEVSPYITECPYCGHRLRKRAPKLDGGAPMPEPEAAEPPPPSRPARRAPRLKSVPRPSRRVPVAYGGRPWVALALAVVPVLFTMLVTTGLIPLFRVTMIAGVGTEPWRAVTTLFWYPSTGYEVVTLGAILLFGWLLERRHGWWAPLLVFIGGCAGGVGLALLLEPTVMLAGANSGAFALLGAWAMRDVITTARGGETETDWLGLASAAVIVGILPIAYAEANAVAGFGGLLAGILLGAVLSRFPERV